MRVHPLFGRRLLSGGSLTLLSCLLAAAAFAQDAATPATPEPVKAPDLNTGDTAWMLASAALVLLMTPGLALFYGGMVRAKNVLNMLMQSFVAMAIVTILWVIVGYSIAFAPGSAFFGSPTTYMGFKDVGQATFVLNGTGVTVPQQVFAMFQLMFAIITPALISGAIAERMKFGAYCIFITLWSLIVYSPLAHMVWGPDGYLFALGALDFAGGTVVHISSGFSALVLAIMLGKRKLGIGEDTRPHNLPMTLVGTGLLWFGWYGFNGGSAVASNGLAGSAFMVTHIAAATAGLVWMLIEWTTIKKPTALGFASGAVAGLVAITPAAGFVTPMSALIIGAVVSFVSFGMIKVKTKLGYDDTLDVFAVHGMGGVWGAIATGLFADGAVNSVVNAAGAKNGLLAGGDASLLGKQIIAILIAVVMAAIGTAVIAGILKVTIGIRASDEEEDAGLDITQHGEVGMVTPGAVLGPGAMPAHASGATSSPALKPETAH